MRISTYKFNKYLSQTYIDDFEGILGRAFKNKDITFLTFNKWKAFYEADPDNWKFHHDDYEFNSNDNIYFPYYFYVENGENSYRLIKFPTKREYKKFYRFYRKSIEHNLDGRENQQEILELAQIIGEKAEEKVKETTKRLNDSYKEMLSITQKVNSNKDAIQSYFDNKNLMLTSTVNSDDSKNYNNSNKVIKHEEVTNYGYAVLNEVPYAVSIKKANAYVNIGSDEEPLFIESINTLGYPYTIENMVCHVTKEVYQKGFVYCRLDIWPEKWIRICDIFKKLS